MTFAFASVFYETGNIIWIHPSKCHKRDREVRASVKDPKQIVSSTSDAEHGTELKLMCCLQRRGFALDMTGVVSWDVREKWADDLFRSHAADVSQATGPSDWPNLSMQIVNCGHYLPARPAHTVKPDAHGDKPLDAAITRLQHDP